jgi:hypothetical protein
LVLELTAFHDAVKGLEPSTTATELGLKHHMKQSYWAQHLSIINRFLGACQLLDDSTVEPSLSLFMQPSLVWQFLAALKARQGGQLAEAQKAMLTAMLVVKWLCMQQPEQPWVSWAKGTLLPKMAAMQSSMCRFTSRARLVMAGQQQDKQRQQQQQQAAPKKLEATAQQLFQFQAHVTRNALQLWASSGMAQFSQGNSSKATARPPYSSEAVEAIRDASMTQFLFGSHSLCHRPSTLLSVKAPRYSNLQCTDPDCPAVAVGLPCKGNRVELLPVPRVVWPHHKTEKFNASVPVKIKVGGALPPCCPCLCLQMSLAQHSHLWSGCSCVQSKQELQLLQIYQQVRGFLVGEGPVAAGKASGCTEQLYVTSQGQPYDLSSLGKWWKQLQVQHQVCTPLSATDGRMRWLAETLPAPALGPP